MSGIYQHFRPEEKEFIDQMLHGIEQVKASYSPKLTVFLDPREQHILQALAGKEQEVSVHFYGGADGCERKRALLFPDYFTPEEEDYQLSLFEIQYPKKFVTIEHPNVLGTLMSLGLKREKFGDIIINGDAAQFIAAAEIGSYVTANLEKIGNTTIHIKEVPFSKVLKPETEWAELTVTVSSMRLDAILSTIIKLSRQKTQDLISSGKVKVNFKLLENVSLECKEGDMISVRGFGRFKITTIDGKTKKEKWRVTIGRQK